eukprot:2318619-Rhodomonas_salina.1
MGQQQKQLAVENLVLPRTNIITRVLVLIRGTNGVLVHSRNSINSTQNVEQGLKNSPGNYDETPILDPFCTWCAATFWQRVQASLLCSGPVTVASLAASDFDDRTTVLAGARSRDTHPRASDQLELARTGHHDPMIHRRRLG